MLLFVGLGNPGERYVGNRHNIGFMAVQAIARAPRHRALAAALPGRGGGRHDRRREGSAAVARHLHERVGARGGGGRALLQARGRRHRGVPRRGRTAARQSAGEDRRRQCRPQRLALDLRAYRQRLLAACASASAIRATRNWWKLRVAGFRQERMALGGGAVRRRRRQCRAADRGQGFDASRTRCISPWTPRASAARTSPTPNDTHNGRGQFHGIQMRHRRPAECRQVDALQCADADGGGAGRQLSVLHHRAECRRDRGARSAPR